MRSSLSSGALMAGALVLLAGCDAVSDTSLAPGAAAFAHESNNRAELTGMQDGTAINGHAIVNYAKGAPEEWRSTVNVQGDLADGTYGFYVAGGPAGNAGVLVCTFTVDGAGRQGCSADTDLPGFARAEVREADGTVVASGTFARRGGNRL